MLAEVKPHEKAQAQCWNAVKVSYGILHHLNFWQDSVCCDARHSRICCLNLTCLHWLHATSMRMGNWSIPPGFNSKLKKTAIQVTLSYVHVWVQSRTSQCYYTCTRSLVFWLYILFCHSIHFFFIFSLPLSSLFPYHPSFVFSSLQFFSSFFLSCMPLPRGFLSPLPFL